MDGELCAAQRRDRLARKESDSEEGIIRGMAQGNPDVDFTSEYQKTMLSWIDIIRKAFAGIVIRRTVNSKDHEGRPISGLEPYHEHHLVVKLHPHEMDNLEKIAESLVSEDASLARSAARFGGGGVRFALFYPIPMYLTPLTEFLHQDSPRIVSPKLQRRLSLA
jgi:hypothetical protein